MPDEVDPAQLADAAPDPIFVLDVDGRITYINPAGEAMLGQDASTYRGRSMLEFIHADDAMLAVSSLETVQTKPVGTPIEVRIAAPAGRWRWMEVIGRDCRDVPGVHGIVFGARDLTQRRMWEVAANDLARFQQIVQHAAAIVLSLDADGTITSVNGALNRLIGVDPSLAVGARLENYASPGHGGALADAVAEANGTGAASIELPMRHARTGASIPIRFEIVNLLDDPVVASFVVTGQDVSDLHAARRRLEHLATHDALTGLANRALVEERLQSLVDARKPLALLYVDLDHFKPVNDGHGHDVGDEVLRSVAGRLIGGAGAGDLVARVGGDEFVVLALGVTDRATAVALAGRIEDALGAPYQVSSGLIEIGASVGAVVAGPTSSVAGLRAQADVSMYAAKAARAERRRVRAEVQAQVQARAQVERAED